MEDRMDEKIGRLELTGSAPQVYAQLHGCQHLKMGKSNDFHANRGLGPIKYISIFCLCLITLIIPQNHRNVI